MPAFYFLPVFPLFCLSHLRFIFNAVRNAPSFPYVDIHFPQHGLLQRLPVGQCACLVPLSKTNWLGAGELAQWTEGLLSSNMTCIWFPSRTRWKENRVAHVVFWPLHMYVHTQHNTLNKWMNEWNQVTINGWLLDWVLDTVCLSVCVCLVLHVSVAIASDFFFFPLSRLPWLFGGSFVNHTSFRTVFHVCMECRWYFDEGCAESIDHIGSRETWTMLVSVCGFLIWWCLLRLTSSTYSSSHQEISNSG